MGCGRLNEPCPFLAGDHITHRGRIDHEFAMALELLGSGAGRIPRGMTIIYTASSLDEPFKITA
jgi:hypothetical protein